MNSIESSFILSCSTSQKKKRQEEEEKRLVVKLVNSRLIDNHIIMSL